MNAGQNLPALARGCWRGANLAIWIVWWLTESRFVRKRPLHGRAQWRQQMCARLVRLLHIHMCVEGVPPSSGILVSNHLGYIDVMVLGSLLPCIFVSKAEVSEWPAFGVITRTAGTLYVQRETVRSAVETARAMTSLLAAGHVVTVFPEGTSSSGDSVLPFQPPLFHAALQSGSPIHAAALHYTIPAHEGSASERVAYWGNMTLCPHLFSLLCLPHIDATIRFGGPAIGGTDRRELAANAHAAVCDLLHPPAEGKQG